MLQRLQSIYLLVAAILIAVFACFPAFEVTTTSGTFAYGAVRMGYPGQTQPSLLLSTLVWGIFALAIITIFKYRDLRKQMQLCAILAALTISLMITIGIMAYMYYRVGNPVSVTAFMLLPVFALIFFIMAYRGVKHDRKLLADSERLR